MTIRTENLRDVKFGHQELQSFIQCIIAWDFCISPFSVSQPLLALFPVRLCLVVAGRSSISAVFQFLQKFRKGKYLEHISNKSPRIGHMSHLPHLRLYLNSIDCGNQRTLSLPVLSKLQSVWSWAFVPFLQSIILPVQMLTSHSQCSPSCLLPVFPFQHMSFLDY